MKSIIIASLIAFASASCPDGCSGHGTCGSYDSCTCFARWSGVNCGQRECPYGLSWVAANPEVTQLIPANGNFLGGKHAYTECSSRGTCNRDSGECECFPGYAGRGCRRTTCPNDCSGHGRCLYNSQIDSTIKSYIDFNSQDWDSTKSRQCVCDAGYTGVDCSMRMCPRGDDPITTCGFADSTDPNNAGKSHHTKQKLLIASTTGSAFFALTYTDAYGGEWVTKPIYGDTQVADNAAAQLVCDDVKAALMNLPNFVVPNVTVTGTQNSGLQCIIEFSDPANSGKQALLKISDADHDHANMQPRYAGGTIGTDATIDYDETHWDTSDSYGEHAECSNRGVCDHASGVCTCFQGYTGESCHEQTIYF